MKITATGIDKQFGRRGKAGKKALDDVSVSVEQGEFVAVVGESGSGKSTLARVILGLIGADAGQVLYDDVDIAKLSNREMRAQRLRVQCILQDPSGALNPRKTVATVLAEVIKLHRIANDAEEVRRASIEALEMVDLKPAEVFLTRYPHQLSGGQRQRVLIARALVLKPDIIIADEAVSALDVSVKAAITNLLKDLGDELGLGYLFITHDLPVVKKVADRVFVMKDGRIVESGETRQLFESPETDYTRELIAAAPSPDPAVSRQWLATIRA